MSDQWIEKDIGSVDREGYWISGSRRILDQWIEKGWIGRNRCMDQSDGVVETK